MNAVTVASLHAGYGKSKILRGVDFAAAGGKITAVVGANGSGKSTLLKAMFGLCDVYSGSIQAQGREITGIPTHMLLRQGMSYVAQRQNVFSGLSVAENLRIASKDGSAGDGLDMFPDLRPFRSRKARALSGGQRQMLAIAVSMLAEPKIFLLDEPTAALSPRNATAILGRVEHMREHLGITVILVEQNVRRALEFCDTAYLLAGGRVAYAGDPQELLHDKDLASRYLGYST